MPYLFSCIDCEYKDCCFTDQCPNVPLRPYRPINFGKENKHKLMMVDRKGRIINHLGYEVGFDDDIWKYYLTRRKK